MNCVKVKGVPEVPMTLLPCGYQNGCEIRRCQAARGKGGKKNPQFQLAIASNPQVAKQLLIGPMAPLPAPSSSMAWLSARDNGRLGAKSVLSGCESLLCYQWYRLLRGGSEMALDGYVVPALLTIAVLKTSISFLWKWLISDS